MKYFKALTINVTAQTACNLTRYFSPWKRFYLMFNHLKRRIWRWDFNFLSGNSMITSLDKSSLFKLSVCHFLIQIYRFHLIPEQNISVHSVEHTYSVFLSLFNSFTPDKQQVCLVSKLPISAISFIWIYSCNLLMLTPLFKHCLSW